MGGAASTADFDAEKAKQNNRINELNEQLKTKEATIEQLEARLKAKEEQALRTTLITTPANPKTKARRGEISAEATNQEQEQGDELDFSYEKIRKDDATTKLIKEAVQKNILFKGLRPAEQDECVTAFFQVSLKAGETAISHGAVGDNFYVVQEGALEISLPMKDTVVVVGELTPGSGFGELALMYNEPRAATITAKTACVLWAISRKTFRNIHLSHKLRRKKQYQEYLRRVPQLQALKAVEIKRLADAVEEEEFEKGMVILREGERGDHFYIIVEGQVKYETKEAGEVGTGAVGDFFGHKALLTEETRAATVTAETTVLCLTMTRSDFVNLLGSLQEIVDRADKKGFTSAQSVRDVGAQENKYQKNIAFEDLQRKFLRGGRERSIVLGQGAFGKVQIVKHKQTGETYALKCLNKTQITDYSLEAHVVCERKVMTMIDHPFLLKLHNSYWDSQYVYFLLELCLGGELFNLLRKMRSFKERTSKFYAAVVVQAYAHLHAKHIVYRDLKPENLMLDSMGYIKVVDFGLAKVVKDRTWTICGTPGTYTPYIHPSCLLLVLSLVCVEFKQVVGRTMCLLACLLVFCYCIMFAVLLLLCVCVCVCVLVRTIHRWCLGYGWGQGWGSGGLSNVPVCLFSLLPHVWGVFVCMLVHR
jgi:CRP-like cAMP-binding protein